MRSGLAVECGAGSEEILMANEGAKRHSPRDLDGRVLELERKIDEMSERLAKLDERVQRIANSLAASQATRF